MAKLWKYDDTIKGEKYLVLRRDGSRPEWPYFVLGAADPCAVEALRAYRDTAKEMGMDAEFVKSLSQLIEDVYLYRDNHPDSDPTAPPQREDNPQVIAAMQGELTLVWVNTPPDFKFPLLKIVDEGRDN